MCGICGVTGPDSAAIPMELVQRMARTMRHRGPDDEGYHFESGVGLGFQRLSIVDLPGGAQPLSNEDDRLWLVFNGEIYNFQALRQSLESTGRHRFKTRSDTEVILHLYEDHGERCVDFLRGMFSFAIWDNQKKSLFIARDRMGKKPLYYTQAGGCFLFASELRALLQHPAVKKTVDPAAIDLYLTYQYIPSPWTIFEGIKKLPPAHTLLWTTNSLTIKRYWDPAFSPKTTLSFREGQDQMMVKLREATALRMFSDVPMGAFLSGGIDSSAIVGLMSEASTRPVQTFSIGFEETEFSELPYARIVAKRFQTDHHELIVKPDAAAMIPLMVQHYGEPFADSSALPSFYLSELTRKTVKVALSGDGGDETLAGYTRYRAQAILHLWNHLPQSVRNYLTIFSTQRLNGEESRNLLQKIYRALSFAGTTDANLYLHLVSIFSTNQKKILYTPSFHDHLQKFHADQYLLQIMSAGDGLRGIDRWLYTDMRSYLPECLMTKVDIASMANSLEVRSPFLDHEFIELIATFPSSWKWHGLFKGKYILAQALQGWMPAEILRRKKMGFGLPVAQWFRGPLKSFLEDNLCSSRAQSRGLFEPAFVRRLFDEHIIRKADHSYRLWTLMMLEQWYREFMD
jgi:asparagine synthase (glutamine-hydrolysing)